MNLYTSVSQPLSASQRHQRIQNKTQECLVSGKRKNHIPTMCRLGDKEVSTPGNPWFLRSTTKSVVNWRFRLSTEETLGHSNLVLKEIKYTLIIKVN